MKIVIKLGGSVITRKDVEEFPTDIRKIEERANEFILVDHIKRQGGELYEAINECDCRLVLINGAGPFGHYLVHSRQSLDIVHKSVECLNGKFIGHLNSGLKIESVAPFHTCKWEGGKFNVDKLWERGKKILDGGKILSTYGDILEGYKVVSGDDLAVLLAELWQADKIIMASDIDGVYRNFETRELIKTIRGNEAITFKENVIDVTGGLASKLRKLQSSNIKSQIINGLVPENIKRTILGDESIGTLILPR